MTAVDIADVDAALGKVREFIALLEQHHAAWKQTSAYDSLSSPQLKQADNQI